MNREDAVLDEIERLQSRLKTVRRKGDLVVESEICNLLGKKYEVIAEWKDALRFHYFDWEIGQAIEDWEGQMLALSNMGNVYLKIGLEHKAYDCFKKMLTISDKAPKLARRKCLSGIVDACGQIGRIYLERASKQPLIVYEVLMKKAFEYFERASQASKQMGKLLADGLIANKPKTKQDMLEMEIKVFLGFALFFSSEKEPNADSALAFFSRALTCIDQLDDEYVRAHWKFKLFGSKGHLFIKLLRFDEALEACFDEQLKLASDMQDDEWVAEAQFNLAKVYHRLSDYKLARSTAMNCLDNIKIRCSDQSQLQGVEDLLRRIFEDIQLESDVEVLISDYDLIRNEHDVKERIDLLQHLVRICDKLGKTQVCFEYLLELFKLYDKNTSDCEISYAKYYELATNFAIERKDYNDAAFYGRKWLQCIDEDDRSKAKCLCKLLQIHIETSEIDKTIMDFGKKSYDIAKELQIDPTLHLEILSNLAILYEKKNLLAESSKYRDECLGLAFALQTVSMDSATKDYDNVEEVSYFGDRKVSKTVRSLMGGDFQMRTKTTKAGAISNRKSSNSGSKKKLSIIPKKRKIKLSAKTDESASDLDDFIVNDEDEQPDTNRAVQKASTKTKLHKTLISSSDEEDVNKDNESENLTTNDNVEMGLSQDFQSVDLCDHGYEDDYSIPRRLENDTSSYNIIQSNASSALPPKLEISNLTYIPRALRIGVEINGQILIIPCFDDDITERKTIKWLMKEASERYSTINEKEPVIKTLCLPSSGAILAPHDPLSALLSDGQTVLANLQGWRKRSMIQEYAYQCDRLGIPKDDAIAMVFGKAVEDTDERLRLDFLCLDFTLLRLENMIATLKARLEGFKFVDFNLSCTVGFPFNQVSKELEGRLEKLDISFTYLDDFGDGLPKLLESNVNSLEMLNVSFTESQNLGAYLNRLFQIFIKSFPKCALKVLHLSGHDLRGVELKFDSLHFLPKLESLELVATLLDEQQLNSVGHLLLKTISLKKLAVVLAPSLTHLISDFATRICRNCSLECVDLVNSPAECLNLLLELTRSSKPKLQIVGQCVSTASKPQ